MTTWTRPYANLYISSDRTYAITSTLPNGQPLGAWVVYPMDHNQRIMRHKPVSRHNRLADAKRAV